MIIDQYCDSFGLLRPDLRDGSGRARGGAKNEIFCSHVITTKLNKDKNHHQTFKIKAGPVCKTTAELKVVSYTWMGDR